MHNLNQSGFNSYGRDTKPLTKEQTLRLFVMYREFGDMSARDELIIHNIPFAIKCATAYQNRFKHVEMEDMTSYAISGIMKAIDKFDYKGKTKFITYCVYWIMDSMRDCVYKYESTIRYPQAIHREIIKKYKDNEFGETEEAILSNIIGSGSGMGESEDIDVCDNIDDGSYSEFEEELRQQHISKRIKGALGKLSDAERGILVLMYGIDDGVVRTSKEIMAKMRLSRKKFVEIRDSAMVKIKEVLEAA